MSPDVVTPRPRARAAGRTGSRLFEPLDWGLLRAPLLPADACRKEEAPDPETLLPRDPRVRGALAVGSQDLLSALARTPPSDGDAAALRGKRLRYLIRMATRPTPYGLFAGVALVRQGAETDLALATTTRTRMRPDMAWLLDLVVALEREPEVRHELRLVANSSVLIRAGRVFLAERAPSGGDGASGPPVSLRATAAVRRAPALDRTPLPYRELAAGLESTPGATAEKVERLITELWQQSVLLTDLRPPLTVAHPARYVLERLAEIPTARATAARLEALLAALERWDGLPLGHRAGAWPPLIDHAAAAHPAGDARRATQVDTALSLVGDRVHFDVAQEAAQAGELLLRLSPFTRGLPRLDGYRRAFEARYGPDRELALPELLDPEFGLGPPGDHGHAWNGLDARRSAERHTTLRDLALDAYHERRLVVELDDGLLGRLETWSPEPETAPPSLDISVFVAAHSPAAIDTGDFKVVIGPNLGATSAGRNLGRFADLLGAAAQDALERVARVEAQHARGRLPVELVYLPRRGRSANVAVRPALWEHEIVLNTSPGVPPDHVIPLDELVVGLRNGRFFVRWAARDTEIVVFQGHMLNPYGAPPAARFLEDVGRDGLVQLSSFDWGPAADFPFLPRVQRGRVVLSLAEWRIDPAAPAGGLPVASPTAFLDALPAWRERRLVPRHVYLAAGDNRLLLDLEQREHAEQLRHELRRVTEGQSLVLQEALPGPEHAWLPGPEGGHLAELVIPVVLASPAGGDRTAGAPTKPRRARETAGRRLRPPGSEWLFMRLYCPRSLEEDLIAGPVRAFGTFVRSADLADAWFFVRYADPDPHLRRLRFRGAPEALIANLLPQLCSWADDLIAEGACLRFAFDTYDRELERYGGEEGTDVAEAIFGADSPAVAELLALSRERPPTIDRTTLAVLSVDDLLGGIGLSGAERLDW